MMNLNLLSTARFATSLLVASFLASASLTTTSQASPYSTLVLSKNPVGYWRLGESAGPTAVDEATPADNGTYTNMVGGDFSQPGLITLDSNAAVNFNGSNSYVNMGTSAGLYGAWSGMTAMAWVDIDQLPTSGNASLAFGQWANSVAQDRLFLGFLPSGQLNVAVGDGSTGITQGAVSTSSVAVNQKAFVAMSFANGAPGTYKLYINGLSDPLSTTPTAINNLNPSLSAAATHIGGQVIGASRYFDGLIDEVALFDHVLTDADIQQIYLLGLNGPTPAPEPSSLLLMGLGCVGLASTRRRARR